VRVRGRVPVVLATALLVTTVGGVAAAVGDHPTSAKACVAANGGLRLPTSGGKCAKGTTALTLDAKGATGAKGARGPAGPQGAPGATGPAGTGQRINFTQTAVEAASVTHYLGSAGPVSLIASCQGVAATSAELVLELTGGTEALSYTGTDVGLDPNTATGIGTTTVIHGSTTALATPTTIATDTSTDASSDVVTLVVAAADGTQVTATLDIELDGTTAPACTVGGTMVAS
jgi:hypothetical protein